MATKLLDAGTQSYTISCCQVCGCEDLEPLRFLGYLPPVNTMPSVGEQPREQPAFPAQWLYCRRCTLVQLSTVVAAEVLFPPSYPYTSGTTRILRENFAELYQECRTLIDLLPTDLCVDIGSTYTKTVLIDETITLNNGSRYTLVYAGSARGGSDVLQVIEEPAQLPTPAAGQIAGRVRHAAVCTGAVGVFVGPPGAGTTPANGNPVTDQTGKISNVAYLSMSPFTTLPVRSGTTNPVYTFGVAAAGSTTPLFLASPNLRGTASTIPTAGPLPGVQIAGSVLTAVVFPAAPAGSPAGGTAGSAATVVVVVPAAGARAGDRPRRDLAVGEAHERLG